MHLIDGTDLFKISNLVLGGKAIVTSLYCSLEGQRRRERESSQQDACRGLHELRHGIQLYLYDSQ